MQNLVASSVSAKRFSPDILNSLLTWRFLKFLSHPWLNVLSEKLLISFRSKYDIKKNNTLFERKGKLVDIFLVLKHIWKYSWSLPVILDERIQLSMHISISYLSKHSSLVERNLSQIRCNRHVLLSSKILLNYLLCKWVNQDQIFV